MVLWLVTAAILAVGAGDLAAIALGRQRWRYLCKPATIGLISLLAAVGLPDAGRYGWLVLIGLLCSAAGDLFLLRPDRFLHGLIAFFAAHLWYLSAFWRPRPPGLAEVALLLGLALAGALLFTRIQRGVVEQGRRGMLLPVALYIAAISAMAYAACSTRQPLLILGAALFYLSDTILAWDRFVRPLPWGDLAVMATYFTAQYLIALSVVFPGA